jgi:P-type conjugative transfer ATPase TrbB
MSRKGGFEELAEGRLKEALGEKILALLADPRTLEIMVNPDGAVFCEREGAVMSSEGSARPGLAREVILTLMAMRESGERDSGIFSCELPFCSARFEGIMPPLAKEPCFCVRRHGAARLTLNDLVSQRSITPSCADFLRQALSERRSFIVCGGTGCGKTTFLNALMNEAAMIQPSDRVISIEDTPELSLPFANCVALRACGGTGTGELVRATLRMRPDRIAVGEVRGSEALDLVDALSSGHSGGMATVHAGSAAEAVRRLVLLVSRHPRCPRDVEPLVAGALDLIAVLEGRPRRRLAELSAVRGYSGGKFILENTGVELC